LTMWYEILPSFFLTATFVFAPMIAVPTINYLYTGVPCVRACEYWQDKDLYRRDCNLDEKYGTKKGNGLLSIYWEGIPDKQENKTSSQ